jgi:hypothetical protein
VEKVLVIYEIAIPKRKKKIQEIIDFQTFDINQVNGKEVNSKSKVFIS